MANNKKLSKLFSTSDELLFDNSSKIVLMSDCHRGDGSLSDDFFNNQNLFTAALIYYNEQEYTYIEIGDGDELWENNNPSEITKEYNNLYILMNKFYQKKRLYLIAGNHDMKKKKEKLMTGYFDIEYNNKIIKKKLFDGIKIYEGLILKEKGSHNKIFLTHGHQGDLLNDKLWFITEFLVRNLWRPLELIGIKDPTRVAKNYKKRNKVEKRLTNWSLENNQMIIAGHTHKPVFPNVGDPLYFNDGCCVRPGCITAIEINDGKISLVKWSVKTREDRSLYVERDIIEGPKKLNTYFNTKVYKKR